ncbi:unnamed protein product [Adineta ricciae]|uniref:Uncharacterized protein n=2 Tax=Adineta ricciae TaxID=249248 RepID=A0A815K7E9_ADIRI|nr:unnamed protein product [Adineta ricciae]
MDTQPRPTEPVQTFTKPPFTRSISMSTYETSTSSTNNHSSGTPKTPLSSTKSGWSWMSFGGNHPAKKTMSPPNSPSSSLDLSHITSRLMVMKTPEEAPSNTSTRSTADLARELLDKDHPDSYMLFSLDQSSTNELSYQKEFFHNQVLDIPLFDEKQQQPPTLLINLWFCQKVTSYLLESPSNVAVLHCHDGKNQLAFAACLLLAYHKLYQKCEQIIQFYTYYRSIPPTFTMSQKRYIQYLCDLSHGIIESPHFNELVLQSINLTPIPLVNRAKTSCRPFVDIYDQDQKKIFSTHQETSKLRVYTSSESICTIPVDLRFSGDLTIHITHACLNNARRTHEGGVRICELTINSNFSTFNDPELSYLRSELDGVDRNEKNPINYRVSLHITNHQKLADNQQDPFLKELESTLEHPLALFRDENEMKQKMTDIEKKENSEVNHQPVVHRPPKHNEPISPSATNTSLRPGNRISGPQSPAPTSPSSSFVNPMLEHMKMSQRQSTIQSSSAQEKVTDSNVDILGLGEEITSTQHCLERSMSSDTQQDLLSSIDSDADPTIGGAQSTRPPLQRFLSQTGSLPTPMKATTIPKPKQETPAFTQRSKDSNYDLFRTEETRPSTQTLPKTKSSSSSAPKSKSEFYTNHFQGLDGLNRDDPPPQPQQPSSTPIGDIQKQALAKHLDPTVLKVRHWTEGKKGNIRALLCSLSKVTWPECKWSGCQMNELLTPAQVKKVYRKAVLHIHPDKLCDDPNQPLAKLIFVELNEAWAQFEKECD